MKNLLSQIPKMSESQLCERFRINRSMVIEDGYLCEDIEEATSHSYFVRIAVRKASKLDKAALKALKRIAR